MQDFNLEIIRSDEYYKTMLQAPAHKRDDIFRYELMAHFQEKWDKYHCPLKAKQAGGYDVVMASDMLGILTPAKFDIATEDYINKLSNDSFWKRCEEIITLSLQKFVIHGVELKRKNYAFSALLGDPQSPYLSLSDNYCGDGGIPGYIFGILVPSEDTLSRLPYALAHEVNHNVRFQHIIWKNDIPLGEYMICEGLAEYYVAHLFGEEHIGPWITKTDADTLDNYIIPLIKDVLDLQGFENITAYMYGDELANLRSFPPAGMPYCAGYACGYHMVKYYLEKTKSSIYEATILPAREILDAIPEFWEIHG